MKKILIRVRSLILIILIVTVTMFSFNSQRASANPLAIVAGTINPAVGVALLIGMGAIVGYKYSDSVRPAVEKCFNSAVTSLSLSALTTYIKLTSSDDESYASLTLEGEAWARMEVQKVKDANYDAEWAEYNAWRLKASGMVDNTNVVASTGNPASTSYGGVTLYHYDVLGTKASPHIHCEFTATAGSTITWGQDYKYHASWAFINSHYFATNAQVRLFDDGEYFYSLYSSDNVNWSYFDGGAYGVNTGQNCYSGFSSTAGDITISTPLDIPNSGIEQTKEEGAVVAVPISGQYDSTADTTAYTPIEGAVAKYTTIAVPVDVPVDVPVADTGVKASDITDAINDADIGDIDIPVDSVPTLNFAPLMVATQKFPFCIPWDIYATIKLLSSSAESPKFHISEVKFGDMVILPSYDWDLADIPHVAEILAIFRWFEVLGFLFFLYLNSRDKFIRG